MQDIQVKKSGKLREYILPKEAAEILHTTESGLAHLRSRNTGPVYYKVGGRVFYKKSDIVDLFEKSKVIPR